MNDNKTSCFFPYKWNEKPIVNELLCALIRKEFSNAKKLIDQGDRLEDIDESTLKRALYEFLGDYDTMSFLVGNGFNVFHFPYIYCIDEKSRMWGMIARAYCLNNRKVIELLFGGGFELFKQGQYWSNNRPCRLWKWALEQNFDKELIDLMLSYGCPPESILLLIDYPDRGKRTYEYINSSPKINWKGYSLNPRWADEIEEPQKPYIGLFTTRQKREWLEKEYEREMYDYTNKKRVQKEFINNITPEEWTLIEGQKQVRKLASAYFREAATKKREC